MRGTAAALILVLGLCLAHPLFMLLTKNAVDLIALGHSGAKTIALLAFLLAVVLAASSPRPTPPPKVGLLLSALLAIGGALSLGEFLWFCQRFSLAPPDWSAVMRDGHWSSSTLEHIHTSKVLLSPLFGGLASVTDAGEPFAPLFPPPLVWLHLLVFVALLIAAFGVSLRAYREASPGRAATLTLCVFALAKNAVDGGPLCPEVWAALPLYAFLLGGRRAGQLFLGLLLVYVALSGALSERPAHTYFWRLPTNMAVLSLPLLWDLFDWRSRAKWPAFLAIATALYLSPLAIRRLEPGFAWQPYALNLLTYGTYSLKPGQDVWLLTLRPEEMASSSTLTIRDQQPAGPFTLVHGRLSQPSRPLSLCWEFGLPISRRPVTWYKGEMRFEVQARAVSGQLGIDRSSPLLRQLSVEPDGAFTAVAMRLAPGVNDTAAMALLGPQLTVLRKYSYGRVGQDTSSTSSSD